MDKAIELLVEMNEFVWARFKKDLEELTVEEANWRPVPEANTINHILRHLRIDAPWHLASIGGAQQTPGASVTQSPADSVPLDFERNVKELDAICTRLMAGLRVMTLRDLRQHSTRAYVGYPQRSTPGHLLGFHLALHLTAHEGQIRSLRNLYRKTRGEPARFFPDNPTFPAK